MLSGSWSHATAIVLAILLVIGAGCVLWPRNRLTRRTRNLRRELLPDPWSGGIVRHQKFYVTHWRPIVGRAYRTMNEG